MAGIWDGCSQRKHDRVQTSMCTSSSNDENASVYRVNQNIFSEVSVECWMQAEKLFYLLGSALSVLLPTCLVLQIN